MEYRGAFKLISIHASREGGDSGILRQFAGFIISIHASREGGDRGRGAWLTSWYGFQSTPPAREATQVLEGY